MSATKIRLNKYISNTGYCTRRHAEYLVKQGKVQVDGHVITNAAHEITSDQVITVEGIILSSWEPEAYYLMNKGSNIPTMPTPANDLSALGLIENLNSTQMQAIQALDDRDAGLQIYTNDDKVINRIAEHSRLHAVYHIKLEEKPNEEEIVSLREETQLPQMVMIDDPYYHLEVAGPIHLYTQLKSVKVPIARIDRMVIGGMTKKDLKRGWYRKLTDKEVLFLKHFS